MITNFLIFFSIYLVSIFSVIGFGQFAKNIFFKNEHFDSGYVGLLGLSILFIYSYISNIFFSHSYTHNLILVILGFCIFLYNWKKFQELKYLLLFFLFLFISLIIFKTHDDFPYYHFGYTYLLTDKNLIFGIGHLNHGFRTPSSIFYLNSLFILPYIKNYLIHLPAILILGFVNYIILRKVFFDVKLKKFDFIFFYQIFSIIFINIFFYRISEHGTDRSAQILIFLLFTEIFIFLERKDLTYLQISKIFLILSLVVTLKAFYLLYCLILIPVIVILSKKNKFVENLSIYIYKPSFYILLISLSILFLINFGNTGCLIYPIHFSCIESLPWSISTSEVISMNNHYEQWSKAGAGPNFRVENPEFYIKNFNWVENWVDKYFFNKVSDFLIGIFFLSILFLIVFFSKKKNKVNYKKENYWFFLIVLVLLFEWFYNHRALRYGGYVLIATLVFFPVSIMISKFRQDPKILIKKISILLIITACIFFSRNVNRIYQEVNKYNFRPFLDNNFRIVNNHYRMNKQIDILIGNFKNCKNQNNNCDKNLYKIHKKFKNYIIVRD